MLDGRKKVLDHLLRLWVSGQKEELIAPMKYDGYTNTELFLSWIEHALCKELKPGQYVIMDNASFHKSHRVRQFIEASGAKLI